MVGQSGFPVAGSFIRPTRKHDPYSTFLEALEQKYAPPSNARGTIQISGKSVEEIGFEKIQKYLRNFQDLEVVILDERCISIDEHSKKEQATRLADLHLRIKNLDLTRNLLESWADVLRICSSLPDLRILNVAGNRFTNPKISVAKEPSIELPQVQELSLESSLLSWDLAVSMASAFPTLSSLSVSRNDIREVLLPLNNPMLKRLDLSFNNIGSIQELTPLQELPELEILILRSNPISDLSAPSDDSFAVLKTLDLTATNLPDFSSLNPIPRVFPSLESLQTRDTPLSKAPSATLIIVARLANLIELNHTKVSAEERLNAELFYLGTIVKQLEATTSEAEEREILNSHPRWNDLCSKHGIPTVQKRSTSTADPNKLAARLTVFTFYIRAAALREAHTRLQAEDKAGSTGNNNIDRTQQVPFIDDPPETKLPPEFTEKSKEIPRTISIYALQGVVGRLFSLPPPFTTTIRLVHETDEWDPVAGTEGEDEGWSVSEDEDEDDQKAMERRRKRKEERGRMARRETELVGSRKPVGDDVTAKEARVRVELVGAALDRG